MGFISKTFRFGFVLAAFVAFIVFIPNLPPYTSFTSIELEPTQPRVGSLAPNTALNNAQKLYQDKLRGPEAFVLYNGEVYTSVATGEIVKLSQGGHVTFVTKIGQPCAGIHEEDKCGRPLGFAIDEKEQKLIVADAYYGIWKVDLKTDKKQLLVSPRAKVDGTQPSLFNSVALDKNGDFYWTASCTDFQLRDGLYCMTADPSGRLFHYSAARNESKVLAENLWFPNGVALSADRQFVVVAETARYRLLKHYVDGPNKGKTEVFAAGLPGTPDNVRALPDGSGALVGLFTVFDAAHPMLVRSMAAAPAARKFVARLMRLVELPFEFLNAQYPHIFFQTVTHFIGNFKSSYGTLPPMSGLVQIDWNGNIVASYYNTDRSVAAISDAVVFNDMLYLGEPHLNNFVGAVKAPEGLKKAFAQKATSQPKETVKPAPVKEAPKVDKPAETKPKAEAPKPTQPPPKQAEKPATPAPEPTTTTPKPTTTTPKPTTTTPKPTTTTPKPTTTTPKPTTTTPKPTTTTPKPTTTTPKPTTTTPKPTTTAPKPTTPPPKPAEIKPKPAEPKEDKAKKVETKPEKKASEPKTEEKKKVPNTIPIEEDIPSDTAKPKRETLKVIKKEGPAEIPVRS